MRSDQVTGSLSDLCRLVGRRSADGFCRGMGESEGLKSVC